MRARRHFRALAAAVAFSIAVLIPRPARASDPLVRSMIVGGAYGAVAGTAVGLIAWPLTKSARSVFIGSSIGLYLGIVVGVFYYTERDNPDNPLKRGAGDAALPPIGPERAGDPLLIAGTKSPYEQPPALMQVDFRVARF